MTIKELLEKRAKLAEDVKLILDKADEEKRLVSTEERAQIQAIDADIAAVEAEVKIREDAAEREKILSQSQGRKTESVVAGGDARPNPELALRGWARGDKATDEERAAMHAFGLGGREIDLRSLSVGTTTAGGNAVPNEIMRSFMEIEKWYGRVQNVAEVINTSTGATLPYPTMDDTSNTGRLLAEDTAATTTTDPTVGVINLAAYKMSSDAVIVSEELLQDASFNLSAYLGTALGTRVGRIKNTYFTTGSGTSQPGGVATKSAIGKTAAATNAVTLDEIIDLMHAVDIAYRQGPSVAFMMHDTIASYVRKLKDSNNQYLWQMSVQAGQPDRLFGFPVIINNDMSSAVTTGLKVVLFGDFMKYAVRIAGGVNLRRSDDLYFLEHQSVFEASQRVDGNLIDTTAVKHLKLA